LYYHIYDRANSGIGSQPCPLHGQLGRGRGPRAPPRQRLTMRKCDKRLEMRLPEREKHAAEAMAEGRGITVAELIRRALRAYAGQAEPLSAEGRACIAVLRRRVNALEARLGDGDVVGVAAGLRQARDDAQALLGR